MRKLFSLIACLAIGTTMLMAQTKVVTGRVISSEDGEPVFGATVVVPGTTNGTTTDADGNFSLRVPESAKALTVSYIGLASEQVTITGKPLKVTLNPDMEVIDEVIVTAYGTSTKGTFTGSATTIKAEKLQDIQVSNVSEALTGTAGVQVQSANGQPGTAATIRVRGVGSINAGSSPLYIVDGVPFDGDLSSINSADIESLTVLKDAASTALYGARGANGIIMVTTKRGKSGKAVVNFDAKFGANQRQTKGYDVMTSPKQYLETQYVALYNAAAIGNGLDPVSANAYANYLMNGAGNDGTNGSTGYNIYTVPTGENLIGINGKLNPNATLGYTDGTYYFTPDRWDNATFKKHSHQQYDLSVAGGNDNGNYYISAGYLNDEGIISGSGFERISTRFKGDYQAKSWLKVGANISYSYANNSYPDEQTTTNSSGNAFYGANFIAPIYPLYVRNADKSIKYVNGKPAYDYGQSTDAGRNRAFMGMMNAVGDLAYNYRKYKMDILSANGFWEVLPYKGVSIRGTYGLDLDNTRYDNLGNAYMGNSAAYGGSATQEHMRTYGFTQQYLATYTNTFADKHAVDVTLGYEGYQYQYNYIEGYSTKLYDVDSYFLSNTSGNKYIYGGEDNYSTQGIFGRVNYAFDEKYIVNASIRRDASSRFSEDNRWGTFWSASAAWLLSNEEFMEDLSLIDMLKFKASFGETGNDAIGNYYAYMDQYSISGADGVWSDGTLSYKGNPDLTWETSQSWNAGFDFSAFHQKLNGSIEYWGRKSKDMLYYKPVASSNGYSEIPMNVGSMTNQGVEIDLDYTILKQKNYGLSVHANATYIQNEINELHKDLNGKLISGSYIYEEGKSRYHMYLVKSAGVLNGAADPNNDGMALYWAKNTGENDLTDVYGNTIAPGQEYKTVNWSTANSTNRHSTKNLLPKWYGGFGLNANAYGFDFAVEFSYQLGGHIFDSGYQRLMHSGTAYYAGQNWHHDIKNAWTPSHTNTDIPRLNTADNYANSTSDRWLTNASYLSLNNITVGYTVPKKVVRKWGMEKVRVLFTGDNVALISARKGLDPRQSFTTATSAVYSPIRTLSGGLSVTF